MKRFGIDYFRTIPDRPSRSESAGADHPLRRREDPIALFCRISSSGTSIGPLYQSSRGPALGYCRKFSRIQSDRKNPCTDPGPLFATAIGSWHDAGKLQVAGRYPAPGTKADKSEIAPETAPLTAPRRKWKSGLRRLIRLFPAFARLTQYQQGK
jgi:hypothetical protein